MLSKIILKNFKSFKNTTEINFSKTNYTLLPNNVGNDNVLKGAILVGANASGKSNVLLAIKLLLDFLFKERAINSGLFPCLFGENKIFSIEYHFLINKKTVKYYMEIDTLNIDITEKLYIDNDLLFERMGLKAKSYILDSNGINYNKDDISADTLFLRTLYFNTKFSNNETLVQFMNFLKSSIYIDNFYLKASTYNNDDINYNSYLLKNGCDEINDFFKNYSFEQQIEYTKIAKGSDYSITSPDENKLIFFKREGINEPIPFSDESCGNKNLLSILPSFLTIVKGSGMLLIDEFSSGFHNELEELLIKYFMNKSNNSQIIFVSHSTNLLSNSILRPDQEYSVEFVKGEGSTIKRFSDMQPRSAQNIEKMYNSGVFGGIHYYGEKDHDN